MPMTPSWSFAVKHASWPPGTLRLRVEGDSFDDGLPATARGRSSKARVAHDSSAFSLRMPALQDAHPSWNRDPTAAEPVSWMPETPLDSYNT